MSWGKKCLCLDIISGQINLGCAKNVLEGLYMYGPKVPTQLYKHPCTVAFLQDDVTGGF